MSPAARQRLVDVKKAFDTVYTEQLKERQGDAPEFQEYWGWVKEDGLLCWDDTDCQWIDQYLECEDEDIEFSTPKAHERWKGYPDQVKGRCDCSDVSYFYPSQLACRFAWWQHLLFVLLALVIAAILVAIVALFLLPLFVVKQGDKVKLLKQKSTTTHDGTKKTEDEEEGGQQEQEQKPLEKPLDIAEDQEYPSSYGEAIKNYKTTMGKVPKLARQESKHLSKAFPKT